MSNSERNELRRLMNARDARNRHEAIAIEERVNHAAVGLTLCPRQQLQSQKREGRVEHVRSY